jgi:colicin import membrane protein
MQRLRKFCIAFGLALGTLLPAMAQSIEAKREANLARLIALINTAGAPSVGASSAMAASIAPAASSPLAVGLPASYAGLVAARVRPNIVFAESPAGNLTAVVEVRTASDGTIVGRKLLQSSGVIAWDEAVMKALDKTKTMPIDSDGRAPPIMEISFRLY